MSRHFEYQSEENLTLSDFEPIAEFVEANPRIWTSMQSARWAIHNSPNNGLADYGVFVKRANKIHVVKPRLVKYLAEGSIGRSSK